MLCYELIHTGILLVNLYFLVFQYCPKLEELSLYGSMIKGSQLYSLGKSLHSLQTVTLNQCCVEELELDRQEHSLIIDSSLIDRYNGKHLTVQFIDS